MLKALGDIFKPMEVYVWNSDNVYVFLLRGLHF